MRTLSCALLASALLLTAACATRSQATADRPVILSLVTRRHTITIRHSPTGPLYTVQDAAGATLVQDQPLESLQANHPDLFRLINNTYAPLDASLPPQNNRY